MPPRFSCFMDCRLRRECMSRCFRGLPIAITLSHPTTPALDIRLAGPGTVCLYVRSLYRIMNHFTESIALHRYTLYMQDYGGPVVFAWP